MQRIATVHSLFRYPVKSMRGEPLAEADLTFQGVAGDRRHAFVQTESRSAFPWLTARELPSMLLYEPMLDSSASRPKLVVRTPDGAMLPVDAEELRLELEQRAGRGAILHRDYRGSYDVAPISIISLGTTARIAEESGTEHEPGRFRANVYVEAGGGAFAEADWVGHVVRIGETVRVAVLELDDRCVMITLDPATAEGSTEVLRAVAQGHANKAGVYGTVLTPGRIRPGDPVYGET